MIQPLRVHRQNRRALNFLIKWDLLRNAYQHNFNEHGDNGPMAISFSSPSSFFGTGFQAVIPGYGNPSTPAAPSSLFSSVNTSPAQAPNLSSLYSTAQSQFNSSSTPSQTLSYYEDPRFTDLLARLTGRANVTDDEITARANGAYSAQRKAAENGINRQQTRALAANGVLPTGGLASQYYNEISEPVFERLDAQRAQTELDLRNQRDNLLGSVTSTLGNAQGQRNQFTLSQAENQRQAQMQAQQLAAQQAYQQAQLQQQSALASQQLAAEQARAQQSASLAQQQLDYEKQRDAQTLAFQREQATLANQRFYSGNGSATGSMGGGNTFGTLGSSVFSNEDDRDMRDNYQSMVNAENLRSGRNADGSYRPPTASSQSQYPTASSSSQPRVQSPASNRDAFGMPSQSFYTPTSNRDAFQMPSLGFNY